MTFYDMLFPASLAAATSFLVVISFLSVLRQDRVEIPAEFRYVIVFAQSDFIIISSVSLFEIFAEDNSITPVISSLLPASLTSMFIVGLACILYLTINLVRKVIG